MKVYVVYKAECIYDDSFDKVFYKIKDAQNYVDENLESYTVYLSKETLPEIYERVILETDLVGANDTLSTSIGTIFGNGSGNSGDYQTIKDTIQL